MANEAIQGIEVEGLAISLADVETKSDKPGPVSTKHRLFPDGTLHHPHSDQPMVFDTEFRQGVIKSFSSGGLDIMVDFNHMSAYATSIDDGRAAGWVTELEDKGTAGLWATIQWTEVGLNEIRAGGYKYLSPEFSFRQFDKRKGEFVAKPRLLAVALTNRPFLDKQKALAASEAAIEKKEETKKMSDEKLDAILSAMTAMSGAVTALSERVAKVETDSVEKAAKLAEENVSKESARKQAVIARGQSEGRVHAGNLDMVTKFGDHVDSSELDRFVSSLPVAVKPAPVGGVNPTGQAKFSDAEKTIARKFGISLSAMEKAQNIVNVSSAGVARLKNHVESEMKLTDYMGASQN